MVRKTTKKVIRKRTKKVQKGKGIVDTAKALLFGRTKLPPQVRKILEKYGDKEIDYIQVARNPLASTTKMALDAVSFGAFSKRAKKLPYDELYHLYIVFTLKNGKNIRCEKNEVIRMEMKGVRKDAESKLVPVNKSLTLNTVMANTKKHMGRKFLPYSAFNNNCQNFITAILKSNKLGNPTTLKFVKQNTDAIFKNDPIFTGITDFTTNLASKIDILRQGAGIKQKRSRKKK